MWPRALVLLSLQYFRGGGGGLGRGCCFQKCVSHRRRGGLSYSVSSVFRTLTMWGRVMESLTVLAFQSSPMDINTQETWILSWTKFKRTFWTLRYGNLHLCFCFKTITTCCLARVVSSSQNSTAPKNSFSLLRSRTLGENVLFCFFSFCLFSKLITKPWG